MGTTASWLNSVAPGSNRVRLFLNAAPLRQ